MDRCPGPAAGTGPWRRGGGGRRKVTDLDVALTDFAITVECGAFALANAKRARSPLRDALTAVFVLTAFASASGGAVHGFTPDPASVGYRVMWPATLLAIVAASAALGFAALDLLGAHPRLRTAVWVVAMGFGTAIVSGAQSFGVAIGAYVPASLWLAYALATNYRSTRAKRAACGSAGLLLGIVAGGLQQLAYTPMPGRLDPNAFYHLLQMLTLAMIYVAGAVRRPSPSDGGVAGNDRGDVVGSAALQRKIDERAAGRLGTARRAED